MNQIKYGSDIFNFYYCKDFVAIRINNNNQLFLFNLLDGKFFNPSNDIFINLYYTYGITLGPQFASIHTVGNKIGFSYCYNGDIVRKILNIKFTRLLKIIKKLTKEELKNEKFKKITMETE